jgi:bile acid:Na+ symporter, BASS family
MTTGQFMNLITIVTLFEMTIAMGLELTVKEVSAVAKDWRLLIRAEFANFVLQPAATALVLWIVHPNPLASAGMLLLAACPAAHYAMPFTKFSKGNLAAAAGLLVVLAASTVLFASLVLGVLLPKFTGGAAAHVPSSDVIKTLLLIILLPLTIGMGVRAWRPALAERLQKPANRLSVLLNAVMIGTILVIQGHQLASFRLVSYLGIAAVAFASIAIGWVMGGPHESNRKALAHNTVLRNMGPGLVIATKQFAGTAVAPVIIAATLINGLAAFVVALWWGRRAAASAAETASTR